VRAFVHAKRYIRTQMGKEDESYIDNIENSLIRDTSSASEARVALCPPSGGLVVDMGEDRTKEKPRRSAESQRRPADRRNCALSRPTSRFC
jgi:hypothetical protein